MAAKVIVGTSTAWPGPKPQRLDGQVQRGGTRIDGHRMPGPYGLGKVGLELLGARPGRQPAGAQAGSDLRDFGLAKRGSKEGNLAAGANVVERGHLIVLRLGCLRTPDTTRLFQVISGVKSGCVRGSRYFGPVQGGRFSPFPADRRTPFQTSFVQSPTPSGISCASRNPGKRCVHKPAPKQV